MSLNDEMNKTPQQNATPADLTSADAMDETTELAEALENGSDTTYGSTGNGAPQDAVGAAKARLLAKMPGKGKGKKGNGGKGKVIQLPGNGLPTIQANRRALNEVTDDAIKALATANNPPKLFRRGDSITRVRRVVVNKQEVAILDVLNETALRGHIARVANWIVASESGESTSPTFPPRDVAADILALGTPLPFPPLDRVVEAPVFGEDGVLVMEPGYHPSALAWYEAREGVTVPPVAQAPTKEEIAKAKTLLLFELLGEFPFVDQAGVAHALAMILHPFARSLVKGNTPLHVVDATSPGTGKGKLTDVITIIGTGHTGHLLTEGRDDEEWRKRITTTLKDAPAYTLIDNVRRKVDSGQLAAALTIDVWTDRLLGQSQSISLPVRTCWVLTGNNVTYSNEIARRSVTIRLDSKMDQPWLRTDFRHPDLVEWAKEFRGELIWAALTLVQAWIAAGRPLGQKTLGNFESWARVMGGILNVAGIPGFLGNLQEVYSRSDEETRMWRQFVQAWWNKHQGKEVGVQDLFALARDNDLLGEVLGDKSEQSQKIRLGKALGRQRDHRIGQFSIKDAGEDNSERALYSLVDCGDEPLPTQNPAKEMAFTEYDPNDTSEGHF